MHCGRQFVRCLPSSFLFSKGHLLSEAEDCESVVVVFASTMTTTTTTMTKRSSDYLRATQFTHHTSPCLSISPVIARTNTTKLVLQATDPPTRNALADGHSTVCALRRSRCSLSNTRLGFYDGYSMQMIEALAAHRVVCLHGGASSCCSGRKEHTNI